MKPYVALFFTYLALPTPSLVKPPQKDPIIKYIVQASYNMERSSESDRTTVLKEHFESRSVYDTYGNLVGNWQSDGQGGIYEHTLITRNEQGKPIKSETFTGDGTLKTYYLTTLDSLGQVIEYRNYNAKDELTSTQTNVYDSKGNLLEMMTTQPGSSHANKVVYEYNDKNLVSKQTKYQLYLKDQTFQPVNWDVRTYLYDEHGNETTSTLTHASGDKMIFSSTYDKYNNMLVQDWYDGDRKHTSQTSFTYVYDKHGNWVTRKRLSNGKLSYIWEREIGYY